MPPTQARHSCKHVTHATHASMSPTEAGHPRHPNMHVTHASAPPTPPTPPTLARIVRHFSNSDESNNDSPNYAESNKAGHKLWCIGGRCGKEKREIDCLCCQEVAAILEENFEGNQCITMPKQFQILCLEKLVLKNVLVRLHEAKENKIKNRSLRFAAYKQFVWWIYETLGKGNRRVFQSCVLWKIRRHYPEANGQYVLCSEGKKD